MSRQAWADKMQAGHGGTDDSSRWREACQHTTLSDRTSDPEAADYDEAVGLFRKGLRCARGGDLSQGSCLIATAFLLDTRAIHIAMKLPAEQEAAGFLLDMALVEQLQRSEAGSLVSGTILRLCIATHFGNKPGGQEAISSSLIETENIIKKIEAEPVLEDENRGILGGCLQRTKIHFLRSSMYMALGNHKKAVKELTAALAIEPSLAYIRSARASLYGSLSLKDAETTFQEWRRVVLDGHPDQRGARVAYAFLAKMALINPKLGTYEEACDYFEKSRRASARFQDIYGRTSVEEMPIEKSVRDQFRMIQSDTAAVARRQAFDSIASQLQTVRIAEPTNHRHACLTCGKHANSEGGQLHKCSRCKLVSYCSRECQKKDWKEHKESCKLASLSQQQRKTEPKAKADVNVSTRSGVRQYDGSDNVGIPQRKTPREPMHADSARELSCHRMRTYLAKKYEEHGLHFSRWWHALSRIEKTNKINRITNSTVPTNAASSSETASMLQSGKPEYAARVLTEFSLEYLLSDCDCSSAQGILHQFRGRVLHDMHYYIASWDDAKEAEYKLCVAMVEQGVFPKRSGDGLYFMVPPREGDDPQVHQMTMWSGEVSATDTEERQELIKTGMLKEIEVFQCFFLRDVYHLVFLCRLFELFDSGERNSPLYMPVARLQGCEHCKRSCEEEIALMCQVCAAAWWCCEGCKKTSMHGRRCPVGQVSDCAVIFS